MALPKWDGAESVYKRLMEIANKIQINEYLIQNNKVKGKKFQFIPHSDGLEISEALGNGDEEIIKGMLHRFKNIT